MLRKFLLIKIFTILSLSTPIKANAERYALIGSDNIVLTVIEHEGDPNGIVLSPGAYYVLAPETSNAESGGKYENGSFSRRPPTPQEILTQKMNQAIDVNKTFLAITTPTEEQTAEQVKKLTQQITAILQYQLQRFEGVTQ